MHDKSHCDRLSPFERQADVVTRARMPEYGSGDAVKALAKKLPGEPCEGNRLAAGTKVVKPGYARARNHELPAVSPFEEVLDDALDRVDSEEPAQKPLKSELGVEPNPESPELARPRTRETDEGPIDDSPPESVTERLASLAQWQARFVVALMDFGGIVALACRQCGVSRESVERAQRTNPDFAEACALGVEHSTDLIEAATFRGATVGDRIPVFQQGQLVGYKRQRSDKAAELMLRLRGRLKDESTVDIRTVGRVDIVQSSEVPKALVEGMRRILAGRGG